MEQEMELMATQVEQGDFDPDTLTLAELIRLESYVRGEWDDLKAQAARYNRIYDKLSLNIVPERMQDEGVTNMKIDGIGRVELRPDMWISTKNAEALKEWLIERGLEDIIVPSVNGSTLKALIKEQMKKAGGEIPDPEVVSVEPYLRAVIVGRSS